MDADLNQWIYEQVQYLINKLLELEKQDEIIAVYLLRSEETGQLAYYSYKQKSNKDMRTSRVLLVTESSFYTGYEDMDWYPLIVKFYYQIASAVRSGLDLAEEKESLNLLKSLISAEKLHNTIRLKAADRFGSEDYFLTKYHRRILLGILLFLHKKIRLRQRIFITKNNELKHIKT